jgi:hypothetical protein
MTEPRHPDTLTERKPLNVGASADHGPDDLMTEDQG